MRHQEPHRGHQHHTRTSRLGDTALTLALTLGLSLTLTLGLALATLGITLALGMTATAAAADAGQRSTPRPGDRAGAGPQPNIIQIAYPATDPQVLETADAIRILFPARVGVTLGRTGAAGITGITGIERILVDQRELLAAPAGHALSPPELEVLSEDEVGGVTDWPAYLLERQANGTRWPPRGGRERHGVGLDRAEYIGHRVDADSVIVRLHVDEGGVSGDLEWVFTPALAVFGDTEYRGLGWRVRVIGLEQAAWLKITEPVATRPGDCAFAQIWGDFIEAQVGAGEPFDVVSSTYFADTQPYYFAGGPGGAAVSLFDAPIAARVTIADANERHLLKMLLPLGSGAVRETPLKIWLWSDRSLPTRWDAIDAWTALFDGAADHYRSELGLERTQLLPVLEMRLPDEAYMASYHANGPPPLEESWFYDFAMHRLPAAAELGYRMVRVVAWESDADHSPDEYLPGSECFGSANAPWRLEIGEAMGGAEGLQLVIDRAHELGIKLLLWTSPGHLSNSSPLLVENPDWVMWRRRGVPEDADYGDVVGVSPHTPYYDYALDRYRSVRAAMGPDGFLVDSHLTFGIMTDYRQPQPGPALGRTLATQQAWRQMGYTDIVIEGCGPLGVSSGGLPGYEDFDPGNPPEILEEAWRRLRRILGREYGLYHYTIDTLIEPESYYRALASGGHMSAQFLDFLAEYPEEDIARFQQVNHEYLAVKDLMERRRLVADGDTWQGVEWTRRGAGGAVLYAFDRFYHALPGPATVDDLTAEISFDADEGFETEPWHTYVIHQGAALGALPDGLDIKLLPNYPNPFNPATTIAYELPATGDVQLAIYSPLGRVVRLLVNARQGAGSYQVRWDGRSDAGLPVASGVYFSGLRSGKTVRTRKMLMMQ